MSTVALSEHSNELRNVYLKQGLPSRIDRQHGDDELWQLVNPIILQWGARSRQERQPVTDPIILERLNIVFETFNKSPSVQVTARKAGSYELEIEAVGEDASTALIRLGHSSVGVFKLKNQSGDGAAAEILRQIPILLDC